MDELAAVGQAADRYAETAQAHEKARQALIETVPAAVRAGARPTDVAARSPFTETYIRKLVTKEDIAAGKEHRKAGGPGVAGEELAAVERAARGYNETAQVHEEARQALIATVPAAVRAGARPTDVAARSLLTETYIRKLATKEDIEVGKARRKAG